MEPHPWRSAPCPPCPLCSFPHFPFCPPPPPPSCPPPFPPPVPPHSDWTPPVPPHPFPFPPPVPPHSDWTPPVPHPSFPPPIPPHSSFPPPVPPHSDWTPPVPSHSRSDWTSPVHPPQVPYWTPPVPVPGEFADVREESSRKRMRVGDPFDPFQDPNSYSYQNRQIEPIGFDNSRNYDHNYNHNDDPYDSSYRMPQRLDRFQDPNLRPYENHPIKPNLYDNSYQNHQIPPIGHSNYNNNHNYDHVKDPYDNSYPIPQSFDRNYGNPNDPYLGYSHSGPNRVDNGFAYRPDPLRPVPDPAFNAPGQLAGFGRGPNPSHLPHREKQGQASVYPSESKPSKKVNLIKKINACDLFKEPHRTSRPDNFVIILRGLPGSGKSYLAKRLRDIEIENGGDPPRIHSMDDYFMIEVEKDLEESDGSISKSRGKKLTKKVVEYCYEAEMEEAYRESMLKAFKKTLDEGKFTFVIVDDRNLRVADFAQFWAISKRAGYEVYLLEAPYKDPMGCVARNVHGFKLDEIKKMEAQWEEAPPIYLQLDIQPLLRGDDLKEESIKEVDMDLEDDELTQPTNHVSDNNNNPNNYTNPNINNIHEQQKSHDIKTNADERYNSETEETVRVKDLQQSKWSKNTEEERETLEGSERNISLSRLTQTHKPIKKSVRWGDRAEKSGFSIGSSSKNRTNLSLVIGPGSGYNLKSNPLIEDQNKNRQNNNNSEKTKRFFSEQLRAESESFKAVFDRRHRIDTESQ